MVDYFAYKGTEMMLIRKFFMKILKKTTIIYPIFLLLSNYHP
jgi:hypothetical protein